MRVSLYYETKVIEPLVSNILESFLDYLDDDFFFDSLLPRLVYYFDSGIEEIEAMVLEDSK